MINLIIENYKKIENFEKEFKAGHVYLVQGANEKGKTSFLQAIKETCNATMETGEPVTWGKENGTVSIKIEGADGNTYSARMDFTNEGAKFSLIKPNMDRVKNVKEIRNIFKFNSFTVEEWMNWSVTAEGRRKQTEILQQFISDEDLKKIEFIDQHINSKDGINYVARKEKNKELDVLKGLVIGSLLSNEDKDNLKKLHAAEGAVAQLKEQIEKAQNGPARQIPLLEEKLSNAQNNAMNRQKFHEDDINSIDAEIEELQKKIKELEKRKKTQVKSFNELVNEDNIIIAKIQGELDEVKGQVGEPVDIDKLKSDLARGEEFIQSCYSLKAKKETYDANFSKVEVLQNEVDQLDKTIQDAREEKKKIYENSKLPADNIVIQDGETFLAIEDEEETRLVPFTESTISYSTAGKIIATMLAQLNKQTGIILLGKASEYDKKSMDELQKIAKDNNCVIFCDRVIEQGELEVKVIE